jgi:stage II sporulation protein D
MRDRRLLVAFVAAALACRPAVPAPEPVVRPIPAPARPPSTRPTPPTRGAELPPASSAPTAAVRDVGDVTIRVLLSSAADEARVGSPDGVIFTRADGSTLARAHDGESWRIERRGHSVRAIRPDGMPTAWVDDAIVANPIGSGLVAVGGKPYRGTLSFSAGTHGLDVVNAVQLDDYLRGVVPLEIGTDEPRDSAAVQAQAVAARSYAYTQMRDDPHIVYDLTSGTLDQVYGGVAAETAVASEAVESTRTLVLNYAGRVVTAPYHSTCGGETAAASELWQADDAPYLRSVSDRIPGTNRYYCDIAPRFRWTRTLSGSELNAAVARYLAKYATVPGGKTGTVRDVTIGSHTASGRVGTVTITTTRGNFVLRGNSARYVLRQPGGEILNSTDFSVETSARRDGSLARIVLHGHGYGHGVGMCQWGAIGRARAGQDFMTILSTYYPGTTIGPAGATR